MQHYYSTLYDFTTDSKYADTLYKAFEDLPLIWVPPLRAYHSKNSQFY